MTDRQDELRQFLTRVDSDEPRFLRGLASRMQGLSWEAAFSFSRSEVPLQRVDSFLTLLKRHTKTLAPPSLFDALHVLLPEQGARVAQLRQLFLGNEDASTAVVAERTEVSDLRRLCTANQVQDDQTLSAAILREIDDPENLAGFTHAAMKALRYRASQSVVRPTGMAIRVVRADDRGWVFAGAVDGTVSAWRADDPSTVVLIHPATGDAVVALGVFMQRLFCRWQEGARRAFDVRDVCRPKQKT